LLCNALKYLASQTKEQLIGPEYTFNLRGEIQLEPKDVMKRRRVASPDIADTLAMTFAARDGDAAAEWSGRGDHIVRHSMIRSIPIKCGMTGLCFSVYVL